MLILPVVYRGGGGSYIVYNIVSRFFADNFLGHTCVPLFFCISGYLFFLNISESYELSQYKRKIKSRCKSLLVPYVIANGVMIIAVTLLSVIKNQPIDFFNLLADFWQGEKGGPIDMPTWYIRDLMVVVVFSPIIFYAIKKSKWFLPVVILICWFLNVWWTSVPGLGIRSFLFFSIGAYFSIAQKDIVVILKIRKYWPIYVIVYILTLLASLYYKLSWLGSISILLSFPFWISLAAGMRKLFRYEKCPKSLVTGTFFVFLYHFSLAHRVPVYLTKIFGYSDISVTTCYVLGGALTTIFLLTIYYLGRKYFPKIVSVIVGGR